MNLAISTLALVSTLFLAAPPKQTWQATRGQIVQMKPSALYKAFVKADGKVDAAIEGLVQSGEAEEDGACEGSDEERQRTIVRFDKLRSARDLALDRLEGQARLAAFVATSTFVEATHKSGVAKKDPAFGKVLAKTATRLDAAAATLAKSKNLRSALTSSKTVSDPIARYVAKLSPKSKGQLAQRLSPNLRKQLDTVLELDAAIAEERGLREEQDEDIDELRGRFADALRDLECEDKLSNFDIQNLATRVTQMMNAQSTLIKKLADTEDNVIRKIG